MSKELTNKPSYIQSLPRRQHYVATGDAPPPPQMVKVTFEASVWQAAVRMMFWIYAGLVFQAKVLYDRLRGRKTLADRAIRLREAFERMGATFIKIGQQMSMRIDLLPIEYCAELGRMLDKVPPMPVEQATKIVARTAGKPMDEIFSAFDPEPIGSASIGCVYQAHLLDGSRVAVKVRRPDIGHKFAADLRALGWLLGVIEWLTILPPGMTVSFQADMYEMLMEELDLRKEARYQWLFRKHARKHKQRYLTAPRIYPELCGIDVLVQEFVEGVWLSELLAVFEGKDEDMLEVYANRGIRPKKVARNLMQASYWSSNECPFFHGDPHPANVLVQDNSKLVFIDFGSCGPSTLSARRGNEELFRCLAQQDVSGAVRAAFTMFEPVPHVDMDAVSAKAESVWRDLYYSLKYKHAPWWERTTAMLWLKFLEVVREFNIPLTIDSLRMLRSSLLYDTLAARLHPRLNMLKEYARYQKGHRRRMGKKLAWKAANFQLKDLVRTVATSSNRLSHLGGRLLFRLDRISDLRMTRFFSMASKASFVMTQILDKGAEVMKVTAAAIGAVMVYRYVQDGSIEILSTVRQVILHPAYLGFQGVQTIRIVREVGFRFHDADTDTDTV